MTRRNILCFIQRCATLSIYLHFLFLLCQNIWLKSVEVVLRLFSSFFFFPEATIICSYSFLFWGGNLGYHTRLNQLLINQAADH